jgi:hypothetical protein
MKFLLYLAVFFIGFSIVASGVPPPSTSQNTQKALAASQDASLNEEAGKSNLNELMAAKQKSQSNQAYGRNRKQKLNQGQNHNLDQNMSDKAAAKKSLHARQASNLDKGKNRVAFSRDHNVGAHNNDHLKMGDKGGIDQGTFQNSEKSNFGNSKFGQKERNGAQWANQDFDSGNDHSKTGNKQVSGHGSGANGYMSDNGNAWNKGASTKFGNNNDFDQAAQQGWGNHQSSNNGAYNKQNWDKSLVHDKANENHNNDSIKYLKDQAHTKANNKKALDSAAASHRNRAANKHVADSAYKKQQASDQIRAKKAAAAAKAALKVKKYNQSHARVSGKKSRKIVQNAALNSRITGAPKPLLSPR